MQRLIFHIDVNSAFLSWEAARRVAAGEADLRLIPSAIGGDREKRSGIILAKSIPAKKYGVQTGEPVSMALRKCPDLVIAKPDFALYQKNSRAFVAILRKYAPVVEQFSIDECFLDFTGTERLYPDPVALAYRIKDEIRDTLGFTVNVGVSTNKLLAKMASDFEKPDKVHTLFPEEIPEKFWPLPVRDLFAVGRSTAERLERVNIRTIGELARLDPASLQNVIGGKFGEQLYRFARGIDDSPVLAEQEPAKCYGNSVTVEEDITDTARAEELLLALADSVTSRMRADGARAECVSVTIRANDFNDHSRQQKLAEPTDITTEVFSVACKLFDALWNHRTPLRLIGLSLSGVSFGEEQQLSLFNDEERERARRVDRLVDSIRRQFGSDTILRASTCNTARAVGRKHKAKTETERKDASDDPDLPF